MHHLFKSLDKLVRFRINCVQDVSRQSLANATHIRGDAWKTKLSCLDECNSK